MYTKKVEITVREAKYVIIKAFKEDPDFRHGYQCNIAMLLHDHHGITGMSERNKAADEIIKLIFES